MLKEVKRLAAKRPAGPRRPRTNRTMDDVPVTPKKEALGDR
jgi:hypothetical protein